MRGSLLFTSQATNSNYVTLNENKIGLIVQINAWFCEARQFCKIAPVSIRLIDTRNTLRRVNRLITWLARCYRWASPKFSQHTHCYTRHRRWWMPAQVHTCARVPNCSCVRVRMCLCPSAWIWAGISFEYGSERSRFMGIGDKDKLKKCRKY